MIKAAVSSSVRVSRIRPAGRARVSSGSPAISGMTATPVSKPDSPSASLGNTRSGGERACASGLACSASTSRRQPAKTSGWPDDLEQAGGDHDHVQGEVDRHHEHGDPDGLPEAAQEHRAQQQRRGRA